MAALADWDEWSVLRDQCDYICDRLNANQAFLMKLFKYRLIDKCDLDGLSRLPDYERNYRLVVHLLPKRPGNEIGAFFKALTESGQDHIVKKLRSSTISDRDRFALSERLAYLGLGAEEDQLKRKAVTIVRTDLKYDDSRDFIGSGSFSEVFKVKLKGEEFAIKVANMRESALFCTEVNILEHMQGCPYIVQLVGICVESDFHALILEHCSNGDLHSFLTRSMDVKATTEDAKLVHDWFFRWRVIFQVALGMQYLHNRNVMHRDVKSRNVYLDKDHNCKVGDFNLSKVSDDVSDDSGLSEHILSTASLWFTGPELFSAVDSSTTTDKRIDMKKYDSYGFGMIVYHVKELKLPEDESGRQVIEERIKNGWRPPVTLDDGCPPSLQCLIPRCCSQLPEHRPNFDEIVKVMMPSSTGDDSGIHDRSGDVSTSSVWNEMNPIPASDSDMGIEKGVTFQDSDVAGFVGKLMFNWQSLCQEMDAQRIAKYISGLDACTVVSGDIILSYLLKHGHEAFQEFETGLKECHIDLYEKLQVAVPPLGFMHHVCIQN